MPLIFALIPEYILNLSDKDSVNNKVWIASGTNMNIPDNAKTIHRSRTTLFGVNLILCNKGKTNKIMEE